MAALVEQALATDLSQRREELVDFLEQIVSIESHSSQRAGVAKVAKAICDRLGEIGFEIEVVPQREPEDGLEWVADVMSPGARYDSLGDTYVARRSGEGVRHLMLLGDLDTAFPPGITREFPFHVDGPRAMGPGVADMKGGLVVLVSSLEALHRLNLSTSPVTVVLSGDEQAGSLGSRSTIEGETNGALCCLCVESARQGGHLMGARGQVGVARIVVHGQEAYGGDPSDRGVNAIEGLANLVPMINQLTDSRKGVFVSVTLIRGGRRRSVIPGEAEAIVDVRTPSAMEWDKTVAALATVLDKSAIGKPALQLYNHRPAVEWGSITDQMLDFLKDIGRRVNMEIEAIRSPAAGSSAFAAAQGVPTFDGLGPVGGDIMTNNEYIEIGSLTLRASLLAAAIANLPDLRTLTR